MVKALDAEILHLVKYNKIEGEIEKPTEFELFCNGDLFTVDHFVKNWRRKIKPKVQASTRTSFCAAICEP